MPELTSRLPAEVSDGSGLAFSPERLTAPADPLDPDDPAVRALLDQLGRERRGDVTGAGWRTLAAGPDARLFGAGLPPALVTVMVRRTGRGRWRVVAVSRAQPLRAARGTVRASSFRVDPDSPVTADDRVLRLLVIEQTRAGGRLAHGRFQTPDLYRDDQELLLRLFITPQDGWQAGTRRWETPVLVTLPEPVGDRRIVDGAVFWAPPTDAGPG